MSLKTSIGLNKAVRELNKPELLIPLDDGLRPDAFCRLIPRYNVKINQMTHIGRFPFRNELFQSVYHKHTTVW